MKITSLLTLLIALSFSVVAQSIAYQKNLQQALQKAQETGKPVFAFIAPPNMFAHRPGMPSFKPGIDDVEVVKLYNASFINVGLTVGDSAYNSFIKRYPLQLNTFPAYLFLDNQGNLIYKGIPVITSNAKHYVTMADSALKAAASDQTISKYEALRRQKKLTTAMLKEYILLKQKLGLHNNAELIEEYVYNLPVKAFDDYNEVRFIMSAGPLAYSRAYSMCYSNRKLIDSLYKHEPSDVRKAINNRIIVNTRAAAIKSKNNNMAQQLAGFVRGTWTNDYIRGNRAASDELLYYYYAVKDTTNYYRQAISHYDSYYMRLSTDSVNKLKAQGMEAMKQATRKNIQQLNPNAVIKPGTIAPDKMIAGKNAQTVMAASTVGNDVASTLNNAAYNFYTLGTRNNEYLTKAMLWSKRSIELNPSVSAFYDTMAHIVYRLGFYEEAVSQQKKAVELAKQNPTANNISHLKDELNKIQARKL